MLGLMQDWPLLRHRIIDHAATMHGGRKVISLDGRDGAVIKLASPSPSHSPSPPPAPAP
jgi:hypothetical protein